MHFHHGCQSTTARKFDVVKDVSDENNAASSFLAASNATPERKLASDFHVSIPGLI